MTDYGHDLLFGTFVTPTAQRPQHMNGPPKQWVEQLTDLTLTHGVTAFLIGGDDHAITEQFAAEVAPAVRELVQLERA